MSTSVAPEATTSPATESSASGVAATPAAPVAAAAAPVAPATYTLTLPAGVTDPTLTERTAAIARTRGLTNEQAQGLLDFGVSEAAAREKAALDAYETSHAPGGEAWTKTVDGWKEQTLADESLGKTPAERQATVERGHQVVLKFAESNPKDADALKGFLNDSGLGNHPTVVRLFAWLGKAASEGSVVHPTADAGQTQTKSLADIFYPSST